MNKIEIQQRLKESHDQFIHYIQSLSPEDFQYSWNAKWTAGQQLDHIVKSAGPVKTAFSLPSFMLKLIFGKANRQSRNYDALVEKYKTKLVEGGQSTPRFLPAEIKFDQRDQLISKLNSIVSALTILINKFTEHQLDTLILPHPLLGKLTLREMLSFTVYHVGHHEKLTREYLQKRSTQ